LFRFIRGATGKVKDTRALGENRWNPGRIKEHRGKQEKQWKLQKV